MYFAHTSPFGENPDDTSKWQSLKDHVDGMFELGIEIFQKLGLPKEGFIATRFHDFGKLMAEFQAKLRKRDRSIQVNHSTPGAYYLLDNKRLPEAMAIEGHHIGLPDYLPFIQEYLTLKKDRPALLKKYHTTKDHNEILPEFLKHIDSTEFDFSGLYTPNNVRTACEDHFLDFIKLKMLFSGLVDIDWLNTEQFMNPSRYLKRVKNKLNPSLAFDYLMDCIKEKQTTCETNIKNKRSKAYKVYSARNAVLDNCLKKSILPNGIYSLTSPTGSGKTLASFAFALNHAKTHNKERIIYAVNYLSIIEQTAKVIKDALKQMGDNYILEHHSNVVFDMDTPEDDMSDIKTEHALGVENWDWPIIFTSNVQILESIFGNTPKKCRKLHNIVNSVIIFDESHLIPVNMLKPFLSTIKILVEHYNCSVIFMSATQPPFDYCADKLGISWKQTEIIDDPELLASKLKRVNFKVKQRPIGWNNVSKLFKNKNQYFCVVNTKKDADDLYRRVESDNKFHLSTYMCPAHRKEVFNKIKDRLDKKLPVHLISTQLIENGCDISFSDGGSRDNGPLNAETQSSGRCDRHGTSKKTPTFTIFRSETGNMPKGDYAQATTIANIFIDELIAKDPKKINLTSPTSYKDYYIRYFNRSSALTDSLYRYCCELRFKQVNDESKLIDVPTRSVLIPYNDEAIELIETLKSSKYLSRDLSRRCQQYMVNLYEYEFNRFRSFIQLTNRHTSVFYWTGEYSNETGLVNNEALNMVV